MLRSISRLTLFNSTNTTCHVSKQGEHATAAVSKLCNPNKEDASTRKVGAYLYIDDPVVADIAAEELKPDIASGRLILESNPGRGILTSRLLDLGCKKLHLFERPASTFIEALSEIQERNPARVELIRENFLRMASVAYYDVHNSTNRMAGFLKDIPLRSWEEEPSATAVVPIPRSVERKFTLALIYALAARSMIFSRGRIELLLFLSSEEYRLMTSKRGGKPGPVLFDLFFDFKFVQSVSSASFSGNNVGRRCTKEYAMSVVRLTPKTDIFNRFSEPRKVEELVFFVKQAYRRGATLMYLNQLIPDSVRHVLMRTRWSETELVNVRHNTKLSSLSPGEILRVFEILSDHDLYPECPVTAAHYSDSFKYRGEESSS